MPGPKKFATPKKQDPIKVDTAKIRSDVEKSVEKFLVEANVDKAVDVKTMSTAMDKVATMILEEVKKTKNPIEMFVDALENKMQKFTKLSQDVMKAGIISVKISHAQDVQDHRSKVSKLAR